MNTPSKPAVRLVLDEYETLIGKVCNEAWAEWMEIPDRGRFSRRSRASMYYDFARRRLISTFSAMPNVLLITKGQSLKILFQDKVLIRIKKAGRHGLGSNILTTAVLQFIDPQETMPEIVPEHHKVEVLYRLNRMETRIDSLSVVARDVNTKLWSYQIEPPAAGEVAAINPTVVEPTAPAVRIRTDKEITKDKTGS